MERKHKNRATCFDTGHELKKHVAVIHSSNKLSLLQRKIANALLYNAYPDLSIKDEHIIHIKKLCELIGYDSHDYKSIKKALVNLLSTVLEWNLVDGERLGDNEIWNASSIIADASIEGGICTYSYSNKMRQLLFRPHIYGRLDMLVQAKFQSAYGLALYENCNRFQDIGQTPWFSIAKFRKLMGVPEDKYKIFRDFKTRVLDKAIEEVNKYSMLLISPQMRREKRQVTSIQFVIRKGEEKMIEDQSIQQPLSDKLKSVFALTDKQIKDTFTRYPENYILEKLKLVEATDGFKNGRIKHKGRYLLSALQQNYQINPKINKEPKQNNLYTSQQKMREYHEKISQFVRYQNKELIQLFAKIPEVEKTFIEKGFKKFLGKAIYLDIYLRSGFDNILIQDQLCVFLRQTNNLLIEKLTTFENWLNKK